MIARRPKTRILAFFLLSALVLGLLGVLGLPALAHSAPTQTPYPTSTSYPTATPYATQTPYADSGTEAAAPGATESVQNSDVTWTVTDQTFESDYPKGFTFTANITSSGGPLTRARIIWKHGPSMQRSRPAELDPATGAVKAVWEATGADAVPPWVSVTYYWEATDAAGNNYESVPQFAEYEDHTYDWTRTETDDIIVFSEGLPKEIGQLTSDAMAEQRDTYRAAWGGLLPYKPRAILFGDQDAWLEWQITTTDRHVVGITNEDWGGTVQRVYSPDLRLLAYGTVLHEVGHLYQAAFTFMVPGSWFIEGNATFFERDQEYDYEARVRDMAASGKLLTLFQDAGPGLSDRVGYDVGYTWWKWFVDNYGLEGHQQLIQLLKQGVQRNDAVEQVTGLPINEVESRWRVWLGASAEVPTLIPEPTMFFFPSPTPFGQK